MVLEFETVRRIGCCASLNFVPSAGSTVRGAVMSTPGMGPATEGLSGVSLFCASHPASATTDIKTTTARAEELVRMVRYPVDRTAGIAERLEC